MHYEPRDEFTTISPPRGLPSDCTHDPRPDLKATPLFGSIQHRSTFTSDPEGGVYSTAVGTWCALVYSSTGHLLRKRGTRKAQAEDLQEDEKTRESLY